ncbi:VPLPA-CTERM sorting domain-containing protein [Meridianimarinicoccus sp. RP-17]|uniref:VPLPA-CTERM sorting domain-containing protein n=1 Tax=Meridianimarinicoccus zhengii TaxID=2056810 RepID=UPI0013A6B8BB|nr:VPLPA-CTERM sorting domain-containing protein [Phycocomes zhengii]
MRYKSFVAAAAAALLLGSAAQAATIYATGVDWTNNGTVGSSNDRDNPLNALGEPDDKFLSLGLGGQADFTFGETFTGPGASYEITFGNRAGYFESADVFAGIGGSFSKIGEVDNASAAGFVFSFAGIFDTLRLVDTSPFVAGRDGYDVDAVGVTALPNTGTTPVPLPASALLLGAGVAGMGALRRRKG